MFNFIRRKQTSNQTPAETQQISRQIIKCRDDAELVFLEDSGTSSSESRSFNLSESPNCTWAEEGEPLYPKELRHRIEPWLTALVQSEHLSLLVGSGLTHAIHSQATGESLPGMNPVTFDIFKNEIETEVKRVAEAAGRANENFEDQVRVANELLQGLKIIASVESSDGAVRKEQVSELQTQLKTTLQSFTGSILEGEQNVLLASEEKREHAFNNLVSFLMSFASRSGTRERLQIFTTNYDRYIEAGADLAGLRLIDRFVGILMPVFRASRLNVDMHYNPPGIRGEPRYLEGVAHFTKLHGSIDWLDCSGVIRRIGLPFGSTDVAPFLSASGLDDSDATHLMIYPNAAKDRETASYPYVELFRDFAASVCRPNSTVICYGYSFGDEHINRVIEDLLTIPSTHLVIISHGDPLGRIMRTYERLGRHAQITLLIGDHLGDLQALVDYYLPKPAIDRTTFRMAELLKARWGAGLESRERKENSAA